MTLLERYRLNKMPVLVLGTLWLAMQVFFLMKYGVFTMLESRPYLEVASHIIQTGQYLSGNFIFYSVTIWLNVIALVTKTGFGWIVVLQIALSGFSLYRFYKTILHINGNKRMALFVSVTFVAMVYYHQYNVFLFTESIFFSLSVIYTSYLFTKNYFKFWQLAGLSGLLVLLCFTRPTGIFFFPATVLYISAKYYSPGKLKWYISFIVAGIVLFLFVVNRMIGTGGALDFNLPFNNNMVICGVEGAENISAVKDANSITGIWNLFVDHNKTFLDLALKKLKAFFGLYRPWHSFMHNAFIMGLFFSIYALILFNLRKLFKNDLPILLFCFTLIFLLALTVIISCDEWHNRFILWLWPFFLMLAFAGVKRRET